MNDDYTTRINDNVNALFRSMEQRVSADDTYTTNSISASSTVARLQDDKQP